MFSNELIEAAERADYNNREMEKILIVEQDRKVSQKMQTLIQDTGFPSVLCEGYENLWEKIRQEQFFLAIVDLEIPGDHWEDAADLLKQLSIPVIVYSQGGFSPPVRNRLQQKRILDFISDDNSGGPGALPEIINRLKANSRMKVLIVDDSTSARQMARFILEEAKFNVFEAGDGLEALGIVEREKDISIIVTDFEMPHMNGYDLVRIIRKQYDKNSISVIGVSHPVTAASSVSFLKSGANDFIHKPYSSEEFYSRVVTQAELLESFQLVSQLNSQKNNIIAMISHDIRGPLASIQSVCRTLLEKSAGEMSEKVASGLTAMNSTSERMLHLLEDLLNMASLEKGESVLKRSEDSLPDLVRERLESLFYGKAEAKEISLSLKSEELNRISFDRTRISQVIDNLISNAVKFSPRGGEVVINLKQEKDRQIFSICDSGPGMSRSDREYAFQEFRILSAKPTGGETSTGLGLAICRKIITMHNGQIWIGPDRGKGAEICFSLPLS